MRDTKAHYEKKRTARTTTTSKQVSKKAMKDFLMNGGSAQRGIGTKIKSK